MANLLAPQRSLLFCRSVSTASRPRSLAPSLSRVPLSEPSPRQPRLVRPEFPLKKVWPPDFSKLSAQEQFRYEKKFNRRIVLATKRPFWNKGIKIAQVGLTAIIIGYVIFWPGVSILEDVSRPSSSA